MDWSLRTFVAIVTGVGGIVLVRAVVALPSSHLNLYVLLLAWGLVIGRNSKDAFGAMLAVGVVAALFWPAVLNIGMVVGLAPVIGVPLPFVAYGGSALVSTLVAVGLLMNVSLRRYVF